MLSIRISSILVVGLASVFSCGSFAKAQTKMNISGTGGIHEIRGRIYTQIGLVFNSPVEVKLESTTYPSLSLFTDVSASYSFTNLAPGNYVVVVNAGDQFEIVREPILIDGEIQGPNKMTGRTKVFTVPVYLQLKRSTTPRELNRVVNVKWSGVDKEAIRKWERGSQFVAEKQMELAEAEFRESIELAPAFAPAYVSLGKLLLSEVRLDEAISQLHMAIRNDPSDYESRLTIGVAFLNNKDLEAAARELKEAAILNRTAAAPRYYLGVVFVEKKFFDPAQTEFEAAREMNGDRSFKLLHRYLGGIYVAKQMNREAVDELDLYLAQNPAARDGDRIKQTIADLKSKLN